MNIRSINNGKSLCDNVMEKFADDIRKGKFSAKEKLPGINQIAREHGVAYPVVRNAMLKLEKQGMVEIKPRIGTFVVGKERSKRDTMNIAYALPMYFSDPIHSTLIGVFMAGAYKWCNSENHNLNTLFYHRQKFEEELGAFLIDRNVNGVITAMGQLKEQDYEFLDNYNIPIVQCEFGFSQKPDTIDSFMTCLDLEDAYRKAVVHLRSLGHERIAFFSYRKGQNPIYDQVISKIVYEQRLPDPDKMIINITNPQKNVSWNDVDTFFNLDPLPTAVITADEVLTNLIEVGMQKRGLTCPKDLSMVAIQDLIPLQRVTPLTTIFEPQDFSNLVQKGFNMMDNILSNKHPDDTHIILKPEIKMKASTAFLKQP